MCSDQRPKPASPLAISVKLEEPVVQVGCCQPPGLSPSWLEPVKPKPQKHLKRNLPRSSRSFRNHTELDPSLRSLRSRSLEPSLIFNVSVAMGTAERSRSADRTEVWNALLSRDGRGQVAVGRRWSDPRGAWMDVDGACWRCWRCGEITTSHNARKGLANRRHSSNSIWGLRKRARRSLCSKHAHALRFGKRSVSL